MEELGSCQAIINKIQTTIDGGIRLTFDISSQDSAIASKLLDLKSRGDEMVYIGIAYGQAE